MSEIVKNKKFITSVALSGRIGHDFWVWFSLIVIVVGIFIGQGLVVAMGVMGLMAGVVATLWSKVSIEELVYTRKIEPTRSFIGDEVNLVIELSNNKPIPLPWVRVTDQIPEGLTVSKGDVRLNSISHLQSLSQATSIRWYEKVRWKYTLSCFQRGRFRIGPAVVESGDPFGFLKAQMDVEERDEILVYPKVFPLDNLGIPAVRPLGEVLGGTRIFPDPTRPSGLRDYQRGDALRDVDWKATARMHRLQVRTYDPSSDTTVVIAVAVDTGEPYWQLVDADDLERTLSVAASIATYAIEKEHIVGLYTNDMRLIENGKITVAPNRGRDQLSNLLGTLATVSELAAGPMAEQLHDHAQRFPFGSTIVLCTSFLPTTLSETITKLKGSGYKIVVLYVGKQDRSVLPDGVIVYDLADRLEQLEFGE